jgi:hypothetical protein
LGRKHGYRTIELAEAVRHDSSAQKHLTKILLNWVDELKLR